MLVEPVVCSFSPHLSQDGILPLSQTVDLFVFLFSMEHGCLMVLIVIKQLLPCHSSGRALRMTMSPMFLPTARLTGFLVLRLVVVCKGLKW